MKTPALTEFELWKIPADQAREAFEWEMFREATPGALPPFIEVQRLVEKEGTAPQHSAAEISNWTKDGRPDLPAGEYLVEGTHMEREDVAPLVTVNFLIDPTRARADICADIFAALDSAGIGKAAPGKGDRNSSWVDKLKWLSIFRLHRAAEIGDEYWQPLDGTSFKFWGRYDTPGTIREMVAELGWLGKIESEIRAAKGEPEPQKRPKGRPKKAK